MGTDIHSIFQKLNSDGEWEDIATDIRVSRNYRLFGWLAGVRNTEATPISEPRGLPEDFKIIEDGDNRRHPIEANAHRGEDAKYYNNSDNRAGVDGCLLVYMGYHDFSWLDGEEILKGWAQQFRQKDIVVSTDSSGRPLKLAGVNVNVASDLIFFVDKIRALQKQHGKIRYVFGFDS